MRVDACLWVDAEELGSLLVDGGVVPALVKHLQAPPSAEGDRSARPYEHEVEKGCAFALGHLAVKVGLIVTLIALLALVYRL